MPNRKLVVFLTLVALAAGLFWSVTAAGADTTQTKTLVSGQGAIGARDGANHFSLDGGATFAPAFIVAKHPAWGGPIAGTNWINFGPTIASLPGAGPLTPQTTIYRTHFNLPATFAAPSLTGTVLADNHAAVFLNGNLVASQPGPCCPAGNFNPGTPFADANAAHFQKGRNVLEIHVTDFGGVVGLDYKATITFTADVDNDEDLDEDEQDENHSDVQVDTHGNGHVEFHGEIEIDD